MYAVNGQAAVVTRRLGKGRVLLMGAHAELEGAGVPADNKQVFSRLVLWTARER